MSGAGPLGRVLAAALLLLPALFVPVSLTRLDMVWASDARMLSLATYAVIYAIVAYGLAMLMRFAGLASVVHGALWGIGAYTAAILADRWGWNFWAILPVAALVPAAFAVLVGLPSLRTSGLTFIIVTLALCEFLVLVGTNWQSLTNGPMGMMVFEPPDPLGPLGFTTPVSRYYLALAFLYATLLLVWLIARSAFGRRLMSIRDNELLARALGLNSFIYKIAIFTVTAMVVGIGGQLYLYHQQAIQPNLFGAIPFIDVLLMVVMGGTHVLAGPAVGAWLVQFLPELFAPLGLKDPNAQRLAYGVLLVVFMMIAPQGIAGAAKNLFARLHKKAPHRALVPVPAEAAAIPRPAAAHVPGEVLLEVRDLTRQFGALRAVDGVTFTLRRGEVLGIIGPNGSGKTTLFNCISGLLRPNAGSVRLRGAEVAHRPMDEIARRGLVRTFQHPMMFPSQTVRQSVQFALDIVTSYGRREIAPLAMPRDVDGLLAFCSLAEVADVPVRALAYGHTRLLGVAMAMAASPHIVMLDEPAAGLNHLESARLADLLLRARETGATLVVVDHDMAFLLPLCDRILVLDAGVRICEGTPQQVQTDPRVVEVYLGGGFAEGKKTPAAPVAGPPRAAASASSGLQLRDVTIGYGPIAAVHGLSLSVGAGEAVALLGANGAGKSTTLRALSGLLRPRSGHILWDGTELVGRRPADILRLGIAHVPEGRQLFAQQTVAENLLLGQLVRKDRARALEDMEHLLEVFPALKPKLKQPAGQLSGGQQQMLAIARGLMSNPRLLLLDEPSLGLSPMLVDEVAELIARLRSERQMSLLLVEQNPFMAARLTERVYVLQTGRIRSELRSSDVMGNVALLDAYLGKVSADALV